MAGMVPYRQPQSGMNYAQLMQMLQMKQMMEAQGQQAQGAKPQTSGIGDLLSSFGGGSAGGAISNLGGSGGASTVGADVLSMGQTMPQVGPTIGNAAALPASNTLGLSGMGAGPMALGALGAGAFLSNIYEGGGKDIIRGKGKGEDYANLLLDINPVTAPINMGLRLFGQKSAGKMLSGDKDRWQGEGNKLRGLKEKGYQIDESNIPTKGRSMGELLKIEEDNAAAGRHSNVSFAKSRNEKDLRGEDLQGYAAIMEKLGPNSTLQQRIDLGNKALQAGAVNEHHGTVDVDWNKVDQGNALTDPNKKWQTLPAQIKGAAQLPTMQDVSSLQPVRKDSPGFKDGKRIDYSKRSR